MGGISVVRIGGKATLLPQGAIQDPFTSMWNHWPLGKSFFEVSTVCATVCTSDPLPFTPLLSRDALRGALCAPSGRCLDCDDTDHSLKTCSWGG